MYYPYYSNSYYDVETALAIAAIIGFITLAISIISYVFQALSLYSIAKRRGVGSPVLAWIPLANQYLLGCVSDDYQNRVKNKTTYRSMFLLVFGITNLVLSLIIMGFNINSLGLLSLGISITAAVFSYIALHDLYRSCCPDRAVVFTVLGIIFGIPIPFFMFSCRNHDRGLPRRRNTEWSPYGDPGSWDSNQGPDDPNSWF
jgi:vacuolar-type H+-ATPase subunit I/STV1